MSNTFSDLEFRAFIYPAFPDAPKQPREYTTDELVCTFLALHDVEVAPVGADVHMSRGEAALMGAAFGLTNPVAWDTMATGAQMKQDARIAARQEWTSWKQWTLGHADWPAFKEKAKRNYEQQLAAAEAWKSDPANQEGFAEAVKNGQEQSEQDDKKALYFLVVVIALILGPILALVFASQFSTPSQQQLTPPDPFPQTQKNY